MDVMESVEKILAYGEICDHCLGRFFGKRSHGLTNEERGRALRIAHAIEANVPYRSHAGKCFVCHDLFASLDQWASRVVKAIGDTEFSTFLIGTKVPPLLAENEEMIWSDLHLEGAEPLNAEMNREVGKRVEKLTGKKADLERPEIVAILDVPRCRVGIQINPVFIAGNYRKLVRGIPQTRWPCRECSGKGCERCGFTGRMYATSVEELIGKHVRAHFDAEDAVLHGAGREDIDALMLGEGRPFVMEVVRPRHRSCDLKALEEEINREEGGSVTVSLKGYADRNEVRAIKSRRMRKIYRVVVEIAGAVTPEELERALDALTGATVFQRTPRRVSHRRADRTRERRVFGIELIKREEDRYTFEILGEAGLYIKELITGDEGRTRPSLSELVGRECRVLHLDVLEVLDERDPRVDNKKV